MNIQSGTATTTLAPANPWALVPPLGNLDAYISAVNRLPLLTHEEEQAYARQLKDNNDLDAAGRLACKGYLCFTHAPLSAHRPRQAESRQLSIR